MDNPEKLAILGTQAIAWRQTKQKTKNTIKKDDQHEPLQKRGWTHVLAKGECKKPAVYIYVYIGRVVYGAGHKAKRLVLQCINGVSSNPVEGRTKICQLNDLILTLFGLIFRRTYILWSRKCNVIIFRQLFVAFKLNLDIHVRSFVWDVGCSTFHTFAKV